jgi:hypothetical protein
MIGSFKISQLVSLVGIAAALAVLLYNYISIARGKTPKCHRVVGKASTQKKAEK